MKARFVRERRCVICDHRVHDVPDNRPPAQWNSRCNEGCECTTAHCQPFRIYADGTTDRPGLGPFGPDTQQKQEQKMTTPQQYQAPSADDFLMGGGGAPSAKFPTPGTTVTGRITERPTVEQQRDIKDGTPKFWSDGNPMNQLVITVQTDQRDHEIDEDDGRRRLFVKGQLKNAVADAVRAAGARGLEVGGILTVTYTHDGQATQRGFSPPKQYTAQYIAAPAAELHTPDPGIAPQQYAPPVAPAPQYAAPAAAAPPQQLANPAVAALVAQQQAQAAATPPLSPPPF
ncbi:hypothetical protein [Streptomyces virginiae]|uniref:hypothetical protein n=1 Tax=Streptomyces virginiae TaxID=1961 RepID=UPI00365AD1E9